MAQTDSNSEDDLGSLAGRVKSRLTTGKRPSAPAPQVGGLKPSEILFMSNEQKKLITYLSRQRYARITEIQQAVGMDAFVCESH